MMSIENEAQRCLKCKIARCSLNCPIKTSIPVITALCAEGKFKEAGEVLFNNNPLTAITSLICPHEKNCFGNCVLNKAGKPIEFYKIEQSVSYAYLTNFEVPPINKKNVDIAVVGAGPAGIAMTLKLALNGYDVTLFEDNSEIGGVLRYGIPDFRLSKNLLALYKKIMAELGVQFRFNTNIGLEISIEDLFMDGYKAVFIATGAGVPRKLGLLGETLGHVHFAIDYLKSADSFDLGENLVVVGAGNVAMDVARTAIRKAGAKVTILNSLREEDMRASRDEIESTTNDGANFVHCTQVVKINKNGVRCVATNVSQNENGQLIVEEDYSRIVDIPADSVILAIGQGPASEMKYGNISLTNKGYYQVNENGETQIKGVFAAGDVVSGPRTVVEAVASAMKAYNTIIDYLEK